MKIITTLEIRIKPGRLSFLVEKVFKAGCDIHKIQRSLDSGAWEYYEIELAYSNKNQAEEIIKFINTSDEHYTLLGTVHLLEDALRGGLLELRSKLPVQNLQDYEYKILGGSQFIRNRVSEGDGEVFSGIGRNVANLIGVREREDLNKNFLFDRYAELERDSAVISRFAGLNAFPLMASFQQPEGLVKFIRSLEPGFSAFRIQQVEDMEDPSLLDQINAETARPLLSADGDEIPLSLLVETLSVIKKHKFNPDETNIGIIGINISTIRLTRLLISFGFLRILGCDNNEKLMHLLEKAGGIATNAENIFTNSDIIFLVKNHFTIDDFHKIRSGQVMVSMIDTDELEKNIIRDRGIRDYITGMEQGATLLLPGLIDGIIKSGRKSLDDSVIIALAEKIHQLRLVHPEQFNLFGDIHQRISSLLCGDLV